MIEEQRKQFFSKMKKEPTIVRNFGGKVSLSNFPQDAKSKILGRLAEKDKVMAKGLSGEFPGLKIDGKQVTRENIHEFEISKKVVKTEFKKAKEPMTKEEIKKAKEVWGVSDGEEEKLYKKSDLEKLEFSELKVIARKFGQTGRSKSGLIKDILKFQK